MLSPVPRHRETVWSGNVSFMTMRKFPSCLAEAPEPRPQHALLRARHATPRAMRTCPDLRARRGPFGAETMRARTHAARSTCTPARHLRAPTPAARVHAALQPVPPVSPAPRTCGASRADLHVSCSQQTPGSRQNEKEKDERNETDPSTSCRHEQPLASRAQSRHPCVAWKNQKDGEEHGGQTERGG